MLNLEQERFLDFTIEMYSHLTSADSGHCLSDQDIKKLIIHYWTELDWSRNHAKAEEISSILTNIIEKITESSKVKNLCSKNILITFKTFLLLHIEKNKEPLPESYKGQIDIFNLSRNKEYISYIFMNPAKQRSGRKIAYLSSWLLNELKSEFLIKTINGKDYIDWKPLRLIVLIFEHLINNKLELSKNINILLPSDTPKSINDKIDRFKTYCVQNNLKSNFQELINIDHLF